MNDIALLLRAAKACGLEAKPAKDGWVFLPDAPGGPVGKLWNPIWSAADCERMLQRKGIKFDELEVYRQDVRRKFVEQVAGPAPVDNVARDPFTGLPMVAPAPVTPAPERWF